MATAVMRPQLLGHSRVGMPSLALAPTAQSLLAATDRIFKEKQAAEQTSYTYQQKLSEANAYTERLEAGYVHVTALNAKLRAKAAADTRAVNELARKCHDSQSVLKKLSSSVDRLFTDLKQAENVRDELVSARSEANDAAKELAERLGKSEDAVCKLRAELQSALAERDSLAEKLSNLETSMAAQADAATSHASQLSNTITTLQQAHTDATDKVISLESRLSETLIAHAAAAEELQNQLAASHAQAAQLEEQLAGQKAEVTRLQTILTELEQAKAVLEQELVERTAALQEALACVDALQRTLDATQAELTTAKDDLHTKDATLSSQRAAVTALESCLHAATAQHATDMQTMRTEHAAALTEAATALDVAKEDFSAAAARKEAAAKEAGERAVAEVRERTAQELEALKARHQSEAEAAAQAAAALKKELTEANDKAHKLDTSVAALEVRLDTATATRCDLEAKLAEAAAALQAARAEVAQRDQALSAREEEAEQLKEDLAEVSQELQQKVKLLQGISHVAAQDDTLPPAVPVKKRGRASPASDPRPVRRVHFQDASADADADAGALDAGEDPWGCDDWGDQEVEQQHEGGTNDSTAMVLHTGEGFSQPASPLQPIVEEVSDCERSPPRRRPAPAFQRKPAAKPALKKTAQTKVHGAGAGRMARMLPALAPSQDSFQDITPGKGAKGRGRAAGKHQGAVPRGKAALKAGYHEDSQGFGVPINSFTLFRGLSGKYHSPDSTAF